MQSIYKTSEHKRREESKNSWRWIGTNTALVVCYF